MIWSRKHILVIGWKKGLAEKRGWGGGGGGVGKGGGNWKTQSASSMHIAKCNSKFYASSQNIFTCECITTLILLGHYFADNFKLRVEQE